MDSDLSAIGQAQRERIFHIDFRAAFLGVVARGDLIARFGVGEAAATRDLSLYRSLARANLAFDGASKTYRRGDAFKPLFRHEPIQTLSAIADGFGDDAVAVLGPYVPTEKPLRLNQPSIEVISTVCRAIALRRVVTIVYRSLSSGRTTRDVAPFALVDSGARWHMRAWDRRRQRFGDFVLTRIEDAALTAMAPGPAETWQEDDQWTRRVTLELAPHPGLKHPETIAADYGMTDGVMHVRLRAAVVGYALRYWGVDASKDHSLSPDVHHLWLRNALALVDIDNSQLAPG